MPVHQLIYVSRATSATPRRRLEDIRSLLASSRRNNLANRLSGFLLCESTLFVQILEGERDAVFSTFERIQRDARHSDPSILSTRDVGRRTFPEWSMGNVIRSPEHTEIYLRNGLPGRLDPSRITAPGVLALAMDLQDYELAQRRLVKVAS